MGKATDIKNTPLHKRDLDPNPIIEFEKWLHEAVQQSGEIEPTAMVLATAGADLKPSARVVLLKGIENGEFIFYTNYQSRKSREMAENPNVSGVFWWRTLARQVRIEGEISMVDERKSEAYFNSRPIGSRLSAIISPQSTPIPNRAFLEEKLKIEEAKLKSGIAPVRPTNWGGYRIIPNYFEFWQGRENRLHDSFRYVKDQDRWLLDRLGP